MPAAAAARFCCDDNAWVRACSMRCLARRSAASRCSLRRSANLSERSGVDRLGVGRCGAAGRLGACDVPADAGRWGWAGAAAGALGAGAAGRCGFSAARGAIGATRPAGRGAMGAGRTTGAPGRWPAGLDASAAGSLETGGRCAGGDCGRVGGWLAGRCAALAVSPNCGSARRAGFSVLNSSDNRGRSLLIPSLSRQLRRSPPEPFPVLS